MRNAILVAIFFLVGLIASSSALAQTIPPTRAAETSSVANEARKATNTSGTPAIGQANGRPSAPNSESDKDLSKSGPSPIGTPTTPVSQIVKTDGSSNVKEGASDEAVLTDIYKVGVGDVLDVRLLHSSGNRSTLFSVMEGGLIDYPIAGGPISVGGLTTKEIQARVTGELKRLAMDERSQVSVAVRQYGSHAVIVAGLVGIPGTKFLRREAVPLYVLLAEVQLRLDAGRATIMRSGANIHTVDLSDSAALGFIVRPGDVINLTARPQEFYYIGGRIGNPGQKTFQSGITLVQAILAAGGPVRSNVAELSRESAAGRLTTTKFNLKDIKSGKIQDPRLQAGDRIEVVH